MHLLGSWGGVRTGLEKIGVTPTFTYVTHTLANVRGGTRQVVRNAGQFVPGLAFDLDKILAVPGTFQVSLNRRYGTSFNEDSGVASLVNPQTIQGRGEIWRFAQFWYRIRVGKVDLKMGRMQLNEDFDQARCDFVGGYLCQGENIRVAPTSWVNTPISQWGGRVSYAYSKELTLKAGVFQYNPKNLDATRELYFGWGGGTGIIAPVEASWTPKWRGRPGTYTLGLVYSNGRVNDPVLNARGQIRLIAGGAPLIRRAQTGYYVATRQQLTTPNKDGSGALSAFFNLSAWTPRTARNESVIGAGLNYTGLVPGRPTDEIGLGIGTAHVNHRVTDATRAANASDGRDRPVPIREFGMEFYYGVTVKPGLVIQPGVQWLIDPGGIAARRNAVLLELKTSIVL